MVTSLDEPVKAEDKIEKSVAADDVKPKTTTTSTWKPNADAAEWKPSFVTSYSSSASMAPTSGDGVDAGSTGRDEGAEGAGTWEAGKKKGVGAEAGDVAKKEAQASQANPEAKSDGDAIDGKADAKEQEKKEARASVNGDDETESPAGAPGGNGVEDRPNGSTAKKDGRGRDKAADSPEKPKIIRYDVEFLLKLRPKPETTPKPAGLNPPGGVDILWDGKEPTPKSRAPIRGIRPLPPLGSRQGSRGFGGDGRSGPPLSRGSQRDTDRDGDGRMDQRGGMGRDDSRPRSVGPGGGRDRISGGGRRPPVDTAPPLEECEPIKINEATRWKPRSLEGKDPSKGDSGGSSGPDVSRLSVDEVLRKANAVLNKMTLEKFGKLSDAFMKLGLRDEEVVSGVIDMLVEKAQMEPHFSSMYAELCERIARTPIPGLGEDPAGKDASKGSRKFRKMLLVKCQEEFVKDWQGIYQEIQNDPNLADDDKAEKELVTRKKYTGHMRFVGELYKVELLKEKHVHAAIQDLFGDADNPDEERLECMVKLLQTCGKKLDQTASVDTLKDMKRLFKRIAKMSDSRQVSSRIRFMLRDLIELRKNNWVPRREEEKAKTMQELHNDIAKEEESKNRAAGRSNAGSSHHGGGGGLSSSSLRPGSGDARVSGGSRPDSASSGSRSASQAPPKPKDEDGWEVVPKKGKGGGASGDGWNQVGGSRSRGGISSSDDRRGGSSGGPGGMGGGGGGGLGQSAFAALENDREKRKKKKDSKEKKDKSTKSTKDKEKKKSSSSKSGSKSSSSRASVVSDAPSSTSPPTKTATAPAASKPAASSPVAVPSMTEETARKIGRDVVAEFDVSGELEEACTCLSEVDSTLRWAAVSEAINDSMERKQKHRDSLGVVILAAAKEGILGQEVLVKGLNDVLETVPDVAIDVPQAEKYVAAVVAPLALAGLVDLGPLLATPCEGLLDGGKAASFAVIVMGQVKAAAEKDGMSPEDASARLAELLGGALDLPKLAAMLPAICRGEEDKAAALLERQGVSL